MAKPGWTKRLREGAERGNQRHPGHNAYDGQAGPAPAALATLRRHQKKAESLAIAELEDAVVQLAAALSGNDVTTGPTALSEDRLDLATFWSRLQPLVQKHQEFFGGLQDAKVQLDFLVACVFLSAFSTVVWLVVLPIWAGAGWLLLAVAVLGSLLTRLFYLAATENYAAFGELVRSSIDLYRFDRRPGGDRPQLPPPGPGQGAPAMIWTEATGTWRYSPSRGCGPDGDLNALVGDGVVRVAGSYAVVQLQVKLSITQLQGAT